MALSLTLAGRGLALLPPGATPSASSAWVFLVIPDPIGAVCLTVVGHDLAWKVLYLVGITGKAVEQVVPKAVGDKDGLVLEAKEEWLGENCQVPKNSTRKSKLKSKITSKECVVHEGLFDRLVGNVPAMFAWDSSLAGLEGLPAWTARGLSHVCMYVCMVWCCMVWYVQRAVQGRECMYQCMVGWLVGWLVLFNEAHEGEHYGLTVDYFSPNSLLLGFYLRKKRAGQTHWPRP